MEMGNPRMFLGLTGVQLSFFVLLASLSLLAAAAAVFGFALGRPGIPEFPKETGKLVGVITIGEVDSKVVEAVVKGLEEEFLKKPEIGSSLPAPEYAHDSKRDQYRASLIFEKLTGAKAETWDACLGIVDVDLFAPGLNFIFGQAGSGERVAVISIARLRQQFYGLEENRRLLYERAIKEAVHELGHIFGLPHCGDPGCVMFFSNSIRDTDEKSRLFCPQCRIRLKELGF